MNRHVLRTSAGRHAAAAHDLRAGRHRTRRTVLAAVAVTAVGAALAAGPVSAHELAAAPAAATDSTVDDATAADVPAAQDAFGRMLADARARNEAVARAAHLRVLEERKERRQRLAAKRARARAAKVRASRAALRSTVVRPVAGGYRLTARFDDGGSLWGTGRHTGLDFACAVGTPVHVVADGTVIAAGYDGAYGNRVEVRHADGTVTTYNHMSAVLVHGGQVHAGEVIGRVGSTGNTTGAHLHFEVMRGQDYVDPETWLRAHYVTY